MFFAVLLVLSLPLPGAALAQGPEPAFAGLTPLNPMAVSRSPLYAQPYLSARPGWTHSLSFDYGSSVEWEESVKGARYVLDAELMRARLTLRRDISPGRFLQLGVDINGIFNGFADGAFDWYHSTMGISFRGREQRPRNEFLYSITLPSRARVDRERPDYFLGDLQLGYGMRHGSKHQTLLLTTVPTSTAPEGYSKETISVGAIHTWRALRSGRFSLDGTVGLGIAPSSGKLSDAQETFFNSSSAILAVRVFRTTSLYGQLFTHSAMYHDTTLPELETREVTGDFGLFGITASGRAWRLGITEDFGPTDSGIDLILRFGISW